jgi:hypothetical protein
MIAAAIIAMPIDVEDVDLQEVDERPSRAAATAAEQEREREDSAAALARHAPRPRHGRP